jgi:hypothetical protein
MRKTPGKIPEGLSIPDSLFPIPENQSSPNPPAEKPVSANEELK